MYTRAINCARKKSARVYCGHVCAHVYKWTERIMRECSINYEKKLRVYWIKELLDIHYIRCAWYIYAYSCNMVVVCRQVEIVVWSIQRVVGFKILEWENNPIEFLNICSRLCKCPVIEPTTLAIKPKFFSIILNIWIKHKNSNVIFWYLKYS